MNETKQFEDHEFLSEIFWNYTARIARKLTKNGSRIDHQALGKWTKPYNPLVGVTPPVRVKQVLKCLYEMNERNARRFWYWLCPFPASVLSMLEIILKFGELTGELTAAYVAGNSVRFRLILADVRDLAGAEVVG